jgi:hypothetical protein
MSRKKIVSMTLDPDLIEQLKVRAEAEDLTVSSMVGNVMKYYVDTVTLSDTANAAPYSFEYTISPTSRSLNYIKGDTTDTNS